MGLAPLLPRHNRIEDGVPYKDKERQREFQRNWIVSKRTEYFAGKVCASCGSTKELELDHIDPTKKKYNPALLWGMSVNNPSRIEELAKCQVLCVECHKNKTIKEMPITHGWTPYQHGTSKTYDRGCRCVLCKGRKSVTMKQYRKTSKPL